MKTPFKNILIVSLLGLLIAANQVGALDGDIVYTYGEVVVHRRSGILPAEISMPVGQGDIIETEGEAMAVISLKDGAEIKLRENTTLSLDSLGQSVSVRLASGSVFARVNKQIISGFSVRTETAVMGVRGTEFFVAYGRSIDRHPDVWVCVNTGSVEVAILGAQDTLIIEEGQGINIVGGTNLTSPKRYPWTRKLRLFTLKNRYLYNTYNSQHSLMVRPGLSYFLMRNREPLFTFSLNYGFYIPLNFGETFFYEHEPYLSVLYHLNRAITLELTGAYKTVTWSSSEDSLANGDTYAVNYHAFVFGFGLLFPVTF